VQAVSLRQVERELRVQGGQGEGEADDETDCVADEVVVVVEQQVDGE